ncbi:stabilin-2-like [Meriones unguiculatus]|uniref:stabilin-2-like n=1 Tax=Meriones unguiculatus TaxID=10047 RepID=UPI00293ECA19|nr:stabilin-2-like [Meriones unguiculatus]
MGEELRKLWAAYSHLKRLQGAENVIDPLYRCICQKGYLGEVLICFGDSMERHRELNTETRRMWQGRLTSFISILDKTYAWPLSNLGTFTVLLSSDKGLKVVDVSKGALDEKEAAWCLVKLHIIAGQMRTEQINNPDTFYTLMGKSGKNFNRDKVRQLKFNLYEGKTVKIIQRNRVALNGLVHILDSAMDKIEPTLESNSQVRDSNISANKECKACVLCSEAKTGFANAISSEE